MSDLEPAPEVPPMEGLVSEAFGTVTYPDGTVPHDEDEQGE